MTGYISDDEEEECLKILRGDVWEKIEAVGEKVIRKFCSGVW